MKRYYYHILMGLSLAAVMACNEEDNPQPQSTEDYFMFGRFYGECGGEGCVEIFRIQDHRLYEDTLDLYPDFINPYAGQYKALPDSLYQQVKNLQDDFPPALYDEPDPVIGMPDAGDWGGIYVEIYKSGDPEHSGFWLLDQMASNMPEAYNVFVNKINAKIALIP